MLIHTLESSEWLPDSELCVGLGLDLLQGRIIRNLDEFHGAGMAIHLEDCELRDDLADLYGQSKNAHVNEGFHRHTARAPVKGKEHSWTTFDFPSFEQCCITTMTFVLSGFETRSMAPLCMRVFIQWPS
jgi:hypothetical protein